MTSRPWLAALACAGALAAAGCGSRTVTAADHVTVAVANAPVNFDPRVGTDEVSQKVQLLVYDNLFQLDDALRVAPALGLGWETPDETTYVVRIREGVRFHDGHELTSADVVFTFQSLIDPAFVSARKGAYRQLAGVDAVDRYTVRFRLTEPFGSFPVNLVLPIVPAGARPDLRSAPVGTGPYRFVRYEVDDRVELTRFDGYWQGAAKNSGLTLKVVPDDIMRGLELRKGSVDLVVNDVSPDLVHTLRQDPALRVEESAGTDFAYLGFNLRDPTVADVRVRRAIAHAIDRDAIITHLRRGLAVRAVGVVPPSSWAFAGDAPDYPYDPGRARALLDEAGLPDPDGAGPRPRLRLTLKVSTNEFYRLQAAVIQEHLKAVGVALDVRSMEFATLYADVLKGNFQLFSLQWVGVTDPDMLRRVFHSTQMPPDGFNRGFYRNAAVDRLIDQATASTDDTARRAWYGDAQRAIAADVPYVSLWTKRNVAVARADLAGIRLSPTADFTFLKDVARRPAVRP